MLIMLNSSDRVYFVMICLPINVHFHLSLYVNSLSTFLHPLLKQERSCEGAWESSCPQKTLFWSPKQISLSITVRTVRWSKNA